MEAKRDVFQAIADPTRRAIIGLVAGGPMNVNAVAEQFSISRQAISMQLKYLSACGLIKVKKQGRERICVARLEKLNVVHEWVEQYRYIWNERLLSLKSFLESEELKREESPLKRTRKTVQSNASRHGNNRKKR